MQANRSATVRLPRILIGLATALGLLLRLDLTGQSGLNQFDEGIYAMAAGWAFDRGGLSAIDPGLIPYAPPGYPILIGLMSLLLGPSDQTSFLVSALTGTLTIPVVAAIAGRVFGDRAAAAAAWIVCCSGPHIAFSRSGLTDASFLFAWGVGCLGAMRFLDRPTWRSAALMGLLVGLAQQFKYNGWLLGAIVASTSLTCLMALPPDRPHLFRRQIGWGLFGVLVSGAVVLPWYAFVEVHGGYSGLLAHQRSYLGGFGSWWPHLRDQAGEAAALSGPAWLTILGALALGMSLLRLSPSRSSPSRWGWLGEAATAGSGYLALAAAPATTVLLHCGIERREAFLGRRFVRVGGLVLFALTPFYHPYARLWLPFEMVHWIFLGDLLARLAVPRGPDSVGSGILGPRMRAGCTAGGLLIACGWGPGFPWTRPGPIDRPGLFAPSDSLRHVADEVVRLVPPGTAEVRTLVRPALSYYLNGRVAARPQASLDLLVREAGPGSWALVDSTVVGSGQGGTGESDDAPAGDFPGGPWEVVAKLDAENSLVTTLDLDPSAGSVPVGRSVSRFWLLRPRTSGVPE